MEPKRGDGGDSSHEPRQKRQRVELSAEKELCALSRCTTPVCAQIRRAQIILTGEVSEKVRADVCTWVRQQLGTPDLSAPLASACLAVLPLCLTRSSDTASIMELALWAVVRSNAPVAALNFLAHIPWEPVLAVRSIKIPVFQRNPPEKDDIHGVLYFALDEQDPAIREAVMDVFLSAISRKTELTTHYGPYLQRAAYLASEIAATDASAAVQIKALQVMKASFEALPALKLYIKTTTAQDSRPPLVGSVLEAWESKEENVRLEALKVFHVAFFENAAALEAAINGLRKRLTTGKLLWKLRCLMIRLGEQHGKLFAPSWLKKRDKSLPLMHPISCQGIVHRHEDSRLRPKSTDWSRDSQHALLVLFYAGAVTACREIALCLPLRTLVEMHKARIAWPSLPWPEEQLVFAPSGLPVFPASCAALEGQYRHLFVRLEMLSHRPRILEALQVAVEDAQSERGTETFETLRVLARSGSPQERRVAVWACNFLATFVLACQYLTCDIWAPAPIPCLQQKATTLLQQYYRCTKTFTFVTKPVVLEAFQRLPQAILQHFDASLRETEVGPKDISSLLPSAEDFLALLDHEALVSPPQIDPSEVTFPCDLFADVEVKIHSLLPPSALVVRCSYPCHERFLRIPAAAMFSLAEKEPGLLIGHHRVSLRCATKAPLIVSVHVLLREPEIPLYTSQFKVTTT